MNILVKKLSEEAILPEKAYGNDAGFDLFSRTHINLLSHERYLLSTDIAVKIPDGYCGILKDRSGNAVKKGVHVLAGVIDSSYIGEIKICLVNTSSQAIQINIGDKIAQMLIVPVPDAIMIEADELPTTDRGVAGFGSTGN